MGESSTPSAAVIMVNSTHTWSSSESSWDQVVNVEELTHQHLPTPSSATLLSSHISLSSKPDLTIIPADKVNMLVLIMMDASLLDVSKRIMLGQMNLSPNAIALIFGLADGLKP
jgi:hypothetical protein